MQYTRLGRSGLKVSRVCLGTLNFGFNTPEDESHVIMDSALDQGINFFDTSDVYGMQEGKDWSENVIGRWFAKGGSRREKTVIATKAYQPQGDWPNERGLSALHIRRACDASLARLRTDYIDLYQMHHIDRETPWDEIWEAMEVLRTQGKILYVGSSNFAGWHIAQAQEAAKARNFLGLISEQSIYSLAVRDIEREVLPAARDYGIGVMAWSPLYRGLLGGILAEESSGGIRGNRVSDELLQGRRDQVERYEALCKQWGVPPAEVALAWLLAQPGVACPIVGPANTHHLDSGVRATKVELDDVALAQLDAIFPGFHPAPEDYAW